MRYIIYFVFSIIIQSTSVYAEILRCSALSTYHMDYSKGELIKAPGLELPFEKNYFEYNTNERKIQAIIKYPYTKLINYSANYDKKYKEYLFHLTQESVSNLSTDGYVDRPIGVLSIIGSMKVFTYTKTDEGDVTTGKCQ